MKKIITIFAAILITSFVFAQAPEKMSYQAVIRDGSNALVTSTLVGMQISILQGSANGTAVYVETQTPTSNTNGLVSLEVGGGIVVSGTFASIDWANGPYFIKTETDPTGGISYTITGTSQLLSVPYALFAGNGITGVSIIGDTLFLGNGQYVIIPGVSAANDPIQLPLLTTANPSLISATDATTGGSVIDDGGAFVTQRGVVWNTSPSPTTTNNIGILNGGSGTGVFVSNLTGLSPLTTYFVRAFATNSLGTSYGNEISFTTGSLVCPPQNVFNQSLNYSSVNDIEGNTYKTIIIGTQEWMAENLRTSTYNNGSPIPQVTNLVQWGGLNTGAWCWYNNDSLSNSCNYGKLYNWYTVDTSLGVCPTGWHVPSDADWNVLIGYIDIASNPNANGAQSTIAGGKMKSIGTTLWLSPNGGADNSTGYSAIPSGYLNAIGSFDSVNDRIYIWSTTEHDAFTAWYRSIGYSTGSILRNRNLVKKSGFSIRCVKD
jgi:uncharacterized protein (TIGR02145 family)